MEVPALLGSSAARSRRRYGLMLSYARRRWLGWSGILATTLLSTGASLLVPLPLKVLIDSVVGSHPVPAALQWLPGSHTDHGLLLWVVLAEILVFVLASAIDVASTFLWTIVGQGMVFDLATIVAVALILWSLDPSLTLVALAVAPLMALTPLLLGRYMRSVGEEQRQVQGHIYSHVQQTLAGMPVVQAFGAETRHHREFEQLASAAIRLQTRAALLGGLGGLGSGLVTTLGTGAVLLVGAHAVLHGHLTIGSLLVFASYVGLLQGQVAGLAGIYSTLQAARPSIDRVVEVLDAPAEVEDRRGAVVVSGVRGEVVVEGVEFGYGPGRPVLRSVSFSARPGEVVAVVGPTGAGKSTLVGLLPRFFDPDAGRVLLDGRDLRDLRLRQVRDSVSLVLQESFLFPFSIAENIAYGRPGAGRAEVVEAARAANAHEFVSRLPDGYDTVVGERGATLSGGERQRVAIARALLKDAPVLVLDEPTSALDAETEGLLLEALDRLMVGRTTVIIAHRLSTVRGADQILVLREGRIVERGRHRELLELGGLYARMHNIQHGDAAAVTPPIAGGGDGDEAGTAE